MRWGIALALFLVPATAAAEGGPDEKVVARLGFAEAVRMAVARNPTAETAQAEIERAEALRRQARALSLPTLTGNGVYTRLDSDREFQGRVIIAADQLQANVQLQVPLVVPQRWANWSRASDNIELQRANAADVRRQIAVATGRAWLTVVVTRRQRDVAAEAQKTAQAHYDYAHTRFQGGVGNRLDEVRAAQELAASQAQVLNARAALSRARSALSVLVGSDDVVDTNDEQALEGQNVPQLATALDETKGRADVRATDRRVAIAEHSRNLDWTDYSPYLVGIAQPFFQVPATLTSPRTGWQAQLVLTIPFYDGGLRYGQQDERKAVLTEARLQQQGVLRQAKSEVRAAFQTMLRADEALVAAREAARLAHESLDLTTLAYRAGATTNIEVIDAERGARDADLEVALAEDASRRARLDLLAASGRFP